jgi:hypothetical protein
MTQPDVTQPLQASGGTDQGTGVTNITTAANDANVTSNDGTGDVHGAGAGSSAMAGDVNIVDDSGSATS